MLMQKKRCQRYNGPEGWVFLVQFGTPNAMNGHGFDKKEIFQSGSIKSSPCPQGLHWGWVGSSIFRARPFASGTEEKNSSVLCLWESGLIFFYTFLAINRDWSSYKVLGNPLELGKEEHSDTPGRASQDCVHDCQGNNATVSILRYAALHMNWWQSKLNSKLTCDPPLKARKPKTRMNPPSPARGTEWPGMFTGFPFTNLGTVKHLVRMTNKCGQSIVQFNCVPWLRHLIIRMTKNVDT